MQAAARCKRNHATVIIAHVCVSAGGLLHKPLQQGCAPAIVTAAAHMLSVRVCGVRVLLLINSLCTTASCDGVTSVCSFLLVLRSSLCCELLRATVNMFGTTADNSQPSTAQIRLAQAAGRSRFTVVACTAGLVLSERALTHAYSQAVVWCDLPWNLNCCFMEYLIA
jgi:hypothetical protein